MSERQRAFSGSPFEATVGYCRALAVDDRIFVAGTAPTWPDGSVDPDPAVQARRCFEIIGAALDQAGASFADVVRTRVYLVRAEDFEGVGRAHGEIFGEVRPANTTLLAGGLLDPRWLVEIEAEAVVSGP